MVHPGQKIWLPASLCNGCAPPPETLFGSCKMVYCPATTVSVDEHGGNGSFSLDWNSSEIVSSKLSEVMPRYEGDKLAARVTNLKEFNEASVVDFFCQSVYLQKYISILGGCHVVVNSNGFSSSNICADDSKIINYASLVKKYESILLDENFSQTIIFRGISGSGKSETCKRMLQCLLLNSNSGFTIPTGQHLFGPVGSHTNPFLLDDGPHASGKNMVSSMACALAVMECFTTTTGKIKDDGLSSASHSIGLHQLYYGEGSHKLHGFRSSALLLNPTRLSNFKDQKAPPFKIFGLLLAGFQSPVSGEDSYSYDAEVYRVTPSQVQLVLQHFKGCAQTFNPVSGFQDVLAEELDYLHKLLVRSGIIDNEEWKDITFSLMAIVHLLSIVIMGSEAAMVSTTTKAHMTHAEALLSAPVAENTEDSSVSVAVVPVSEVVLKKAGGADNKPLEAKAVIESLCYELYSRIVAFLMNRCCTITDKEAETTKMLSINLLDVGGPDITSNTAAGYGHFLTNIFAEQLCDVFIADSFHKVIKLYAAENIFIPESEIIIPDNELCHALEAPTTGLFSILEDVSIFPKGDDRSFAEKVLAVHSGTCFVKSCPARSAGVAKATQFIVTHNFGEITYDCEHFVQRNRNKASLEVFEFIDKLPFSYISSSLPPSSGDGNGDGSKAPPPPPAVSAAKAKFGGGPKEKPIQKPNLSLTRARTVFSNKIMDKIEKSSSRHYVLCINPHRQQVKDDAMIDPSFLLDQIRYLSILELTMLNKYADFPFNGSYREFYYYFRVILPYVTKEKLPWLLPVNVDARELEVLCRNLLKACLVALCFDASVYSADVIFAKKKLMVKDRLFSEMDSMRSNHLRKYKFAAELLQSVWRRRKVLILFKRMKSSAIRIQALQRKNNDKRKYNLSVSAICRIQGTLLRRYYRRKFLLWRWAADVLKNRFFSCMIHKVRFKRLKNSIRLAQYMARGFLVQQQVLHTSRSVMMLQIGVRSFLRRRRVKLIRENAILSVQRIFRGWLCRERHSKIVRVIHARRSLRVATRCVCKLQSVWRRIRIRKRMNALTIAAVCVQRWSKATKQRKKFLLTLVLVQWLQGTARRLAANTRVNLIRLSSMLAEEHKRLWRCRQQEISMLDKPAVVDRRYMSPTKKAVSTRTTPLSTATAAVVKEPTSFKPQFDKSVGYQIASGLVKDGQIKYSRLVAGLDVHFDLTEAYPDGWLNTTLQFYYSLEQVKRRKIARMAIGRYHTVFVDELHDVYSFGLSDVGQLGHGNKINLSYPQRISSLSQYIVQVETSCALPNAHISNVNQPAFTIQSIECGKDFTVVLSGSGRVYSWGANNRGQLGHSLFNSSSVPRVVESVKNVKSISCGAYHCASLTYGGTVYTWGAAECLGRKSVPAQVGKASGLDALDSCEPHLVTSLHKRGTISVVCGDVHTIAAHVDIKLGTVLFAWGLNINGQLGIGNKLNSVLPTSVKLPISILESDGRNSQLCAGGRHSGICVRGKLYLWGWNKYGQIGNGNTKDVVTPVLVSCPNDKVSSLKNKKSPNHHIKCVSLGWRYSAAVTQAQHDQDSSVYYWGYSDALFSNGHDGVEKRVKNPSAPEGCVVRPSLQPMCIGSYSASCTPTSSSESMSTPTAGTTSNTGPVLSMTGSVSSSTLTVLAVDRVKKVVADPKLLQLYNSTKHRSDRDVQPMLPQNSIARNDVKVKANLQSETSKRFRETFVNEKIAVKRNGSSARVSSDSLVANPAAPALSSTSPALQMHRTNVSPPRVPWEESDTTAPLSFSSTSRLKASTSASLTNPRPVAYDRSNEGRLTNEGMMSLFSPIRAPSFKPVEAVKMPSFVEDSIVSAVASPSRHGSKANNPVDAVTTAGRPKLQLHSRGKSSAAHSSHNTAVVRDLSAMVLNIKKDSATMLSSTWKR